MKNVARYAGFVVCSLIGFVIGHYLLTGAAAAYTSVLVSYHLYLLLLILLSDQKRTVALPVGQTFMTHLAFLGVLIGMPFLRAYIPFFGIIRLLVPALAPFEVKWLFSTDKVPEKSSTETVRTIPADPKKKKGETYSVDDLINAASAQDHEMFLAYMRQPNRTFSRPGRGIREEYGYWLVDLAKKRSAMAATAAATASSSGATNTTSPAGQ
ncbi:MAG TPA: hypothetical protein VME23_10050 [Terracidiphilus sp.]|nr:hypothetical protein [Terracidiphilus sp.]